MVRKYVHILHGDILQDLTIVNIPHRLVIPNFWRQKNRTKRDTLPVRRSNIDFCISQESLQINQSYNSTLGCELSSVEQRPNELVNLLMFRIVSIVIFWNTFSLEIKKSQVILFNLQTRLRNISTTVYYRKRVEFLVEYIYLTLGCSIFYVIVYR